jgi:hypothetical protein
VSRDRRISKKFKMELTVDLLQVNQVSFAALCLVCCSLIDLETFCHFWTGRQAFVWLRIAATVIINVRCLIA